MSVDIVTTLKAIDIFSSLTDEIIHSLSKKLQPVSLEADEVLFNKGDQGNSLYLVQKGLVKVISTDSEGHELILNQVGDGGIIGEMALIDQEPRSAGVIAVTSASLLQLSSDDFFEVIQNNPEVALKISRYLTQRLRVNTTQIENAVPNEALEARIEARTADLASDNQKLREMATTDPLTGIFNRRHFFELAQQEFAKSRRYGHPISAIMIDLDHFKQINDQYGHLAGDLVLKAAAKLIKDNIRDIDILARYGGEEFAILLPNADLQDTGELAERICAVIEAQAVQVEDLTIPVTASLGVASVSDVAGLDVEKLLDKADQALYEAKETGRNRVAVWKES